MQAPGQWTVRAICTSGWRLKYLAQVRVRDQGTSGSQKGTAYLAAKGFVPATDSRNGGVHEEAGYGSCRGI
jgi:hypothetical protein